MIKVQDVSHVRFSAPDLGRMRDFLVAFGLVPAEDVGDGVLRMRGAGSAPYIHETVLGAPGFVALGLRAASVADLDALAAAEGGTVRKATTPGGGKVLSLRDPDGILVEIVAGQQEVTLEEPGVRDAWNIASSRARTNVAKRVAAGPAHVVRLGHVVLGVHDVAKTWAWWESRFGLLMSDEVRNEEDELVAAFIRCDRGEESTDHHSLNFAAMADAPKFHHAAFEVGDLDDLMAGHEHLKVSGFQHDWGVGRHVLGSQVFDYWKDPWGNRVEHWTDGDLFAADAPMNVASVQTMMGLQWGPSSPADFAT